MKLNIEIKDIIIKPYSGTIWNRVFVFLGYQSPQTMGGN